MTAHAIERAKERFDLDLTPDVTNRFIAEIEAQRAIKMSRAGNRAVWAVRINGMIYLVVYEKSTKSLITFLPPAGKDISTMITRAQILFLSQDRNRLQQHKRKLGHSRGTK